MEKTLAQAISAYGVEPQPLLPNNVVRRSLYDYRREIEENRRFANDGVACAVINRIVDVSCTRLYNRRDGASDAELAYFNRIAKLAESIFGQAVAEYFISGLSLPDFILERTVGNRISADFGRKRIFTPPSFFIRDPMTIDIERHPYLDTPILYLEIPPEEIKLVKNGGIYENGRLNTEPYELYVRNFPEYVSLIRAGKTKIMLKDRKAMLRKPTSYDPFPRPYLSPAIESLKHKRMLKMMDYQTAQRANEAILHVKAGNDTFPVVEGDPTLENISRQISLRPNTSVYRLYTNHTVELRWVYPPLEALLSKDKYEEPNADIFLALGFSRALLIGEMQRSNTGSAALANLGPLAIIQDARRAFVMWLKSVYTYLAEVNNFDNVPSPKLIPVRTSDFMAMLIYAVAAVRENIISRETASAMFEQVYDEEFIQINEEVEGVERLERLQNEEVGV